MNKYPSDFEAREAIIDVGRRLYERSYVAANDGNISVRVGENAVWATPTNVSKGSLTHEMLVKSDLDGNILEGTRKPSSEVKMHLAIYRRSATIMSVCHAHPPVSTTFAAAGIPLDVAYLQEAAVLLGVIPLAEYALPSTDALAEGAALYCPDYNGVLLEHHGAVAWGTSAEQALHRLESIEFNATIAMNMRMMGIDRPMTNAQIQELLKFRPAWGVTGGGIPKGRD